MKLVILFAMHKKKGRDYLFYGYFESLCAEKGISVNKACQEMGVSRSVASKWKSTNTEPSMGTMIKISTYFEKPIEELLAHSNKSPEASIEALKKENPDAIKDIEADDKDQIISKLSKLLKENQKDTVIALLEELTQRP